MELVKTANVEKYVIVIAYSALFTCELYRIFQALADVRVSYTVNNILREVYFSTSCVVFSFESLHNSKILGFTYWVTYWVNYLA